MRDRNCSSQRCRLEKFSHVSTNACQVIISTLCWWTLNLEWNWNMHLSQAATYINWISCFSQVLAIIANEELSHLIIIIYFAPSGVWKLARYYCCGQAMQIPHELQTRTVLMNQKLICCHFGQDKCCESFFSPVWGIQKLLNNWFAFMAKTISKLLQRCFKLDSN